MPFVPPVCPNRRCPSATQSIAFRWQHRGSFRRACDGKLVLRYSCRVCRRGFSSQTFRVDYRLKKPRLDLPVFHAFVSKVSHRQCARVLGVKRETIERRLRRYGWQCRELHRARLGSSSIHGVFQLDEAETFEGHRIERPLTLPVLIERDSRYIVHLETATLPSRRNRAGRRERPTPSKVSSPRMTRRTSGSNVAVRHCFERLAARLRTDGVLVQTDRKATYPVLLRDAMHGRAIRHERTSSKRKRDARNPLFAINHTLAMLRDGVSRLVRRTWAHAKLAERLELHLWIYCAWRNYVRDITNRKRRVTPAMAIGVERERWTSTGVLHWSAKFPTLLDAH